MTISTHRPRSVSRETAPECPRERTVCALEQLRAQSGDDAVRDEIAAWHGRWLHDHMTQTLGEEGVRDWQEAARRECTAAVAPAADAMANEPRQAGALHAEGGAA